MRSRPTAVLSLLVFATACGGGAESTRPPSPAVTSVTIEASASTMRVGETLQLGVTAKGPTGVTVTLSENPRWSTSNAQVATVDQTGRITAVAAGTTTISATAAGVTGTRTFTVMGGAGNLVDVFTPGNTFSPFSVVVALGGTVRFNITGAPHNVIFNRSSAATANAPADINLVSNVTVSRTFNARGTFPYDCTVHPGMIGQVVVQ